MMFVAIVIGIAVLLFGLTVRNAWKQEQEANRAAKALRRARRRMDQNELSVRYLSGRF